MRSKEESRKRTKMSDELDIKKARLAMIAMDIHQCSNSLHEAKPGSANEDRLIAKIQAYKVDYDVYRDEIQMAETRNKEQEALDTFLEAANKPYDASDLVWTTPSSGTTTTLGSFAYCAPLTPIYNLSQSNKA